MLSSSFTSPTHVYEFLFMLLLLVILLKVNKTLHPTFLENICYIYVNHRERDGGKGKGREEEGRKKVGILHSTVCRYELCSDIIILSHNSRNSGILNL